MGIINSIVEAEMTVEESAELSHLEDELSQACDDLYFAQMDKQPYMHDSIVTCIEVLDKQEQRLNKYMADVTIKVLARMKQFE